MFTATQFRERANQLVGVPYVLGAEWSPTTVAPALPSAVDCSELVEGLYRENSTPITDLAAAQYDATHPVPTGEEAVGDLVFLRNNTARWNGIGHVAVVTARLANGDWEVIEARGRVWGTVRTTLSYWRSRMFFAGVRRFSAFKLAAAPAGVITPVPAPDAKKIKPRHCNDTDDTFLRLVQEVCGVNVDGDKGPKTRAGIRRMQQRLGVGIDADWGPATTKAWLLSQPTLREGSDGLAVAIAQWIVGATIDWAFGPRTGDSVEGAQRWCGISADRVVGPATKRAITI